MHSSVGVNRFFYPGNLGMYKTHIVAVIYLLTAVSHHELFGSEHTLLGCRVRAAEKS